MLNLSPRHPREKDVDGIADHMQIPLCNRLPRHRKTLGETKRERERESHKDGQAAYTVCYRETGATREVRAPLHAFYSRAEAWVSECQVLIHHGVEGICKYSSLPPA